MIKNVVNIILIFLIFKTTGLSNENYVRQFYLRPEICYDNNIYENTQGIKYEDISISFWYGGKLQKNINKIILKGQIIGYYANYSHYNDENKGFNNIKLNLSYLLPKRVFLYGQYNNFGKYWPNTISGYFHNTASIGIGKSIKRITSVFELYSAKSKYSHYDYYNNSKKGINLSNYYILSPRFHFHFIIHSSKINFDANRNENFFTSKLGIEYKNNIIIGTDFQFSNVKSNLDYNSNRLLYISPYLSAELYNFYIQLSARFTLKEYNQSISATLENKTLITPDPEENIYNRFFLKVEYPFSPKLSTTGKLVLIQNEYRYINRYYEKLLFGFGLQYNFR